MATGSKTLTATFPRTVSLYEGSDVRVLGVPIGKVESVTPHATEVEVTMSYDADAADSRGRRGGRDLAVDRR